MTSIPLYTIAIFYLIFLGIFVVFAFINIMHIIETGTFTFISMVFTIKIIALTFLILYVTWYLLQSTDWHYLITIWNDDWIKDTFNLSSPNNF